MGQNSEHWINEPDIGSGEKNAAQRELEREQAGVTNEEMDHAETDAQTLQRGDHLARIALRKLDDGLIEAQVFVRLLHEPEVAETYIPAGTFGNEEDARNAAMERAQRALSEREF